MTQISKVLLVNPPDHALVKASSPLEYSYFEPPLGCLYVYSYLRRKSEIEANFIDLNIEFKFFSNGRSFDEVIRDFCIKFSPDMVCISALYYSEIEVFHLVAGLFKKYVPKVVIVMGGHYPSHMTETCLEDTNVDYATLAEGELSTAELIDALNGKIDLAKVEGLAYRSGKGIVKQKRIHFWKDYKYVPRLDWEHTRFDKYFLEGRNVLDRVFPSESVKIASLTATRGCPNNCAFCSSPSFWRRRWRGRDIRLVVDEVRYLRDVEGVNTFAFNDENIAANRKWFDTFLDEIGKLGVRWFSSGGLEVRQLANRDTVRKMYDSGMCLFNMAIESGNNRTLKKVNKPLTVEETLQAVENVRTEGNGYTTGFFITGFPFEAMEDVKRTHEFASRLDLDWKCFFCFQPFPGSALYKECMEQGLIDSFNAQYGENYFAPALKHIDYSSQELERANYSVNMKVNFLENRNLLSGTQSGLVQAERDFNYVLGLVDNHVFAHIALSEVEMKKGNPDRALDHLQKAHKESVKGAFDWREYLNILSVNLEEKIKDIKGVSDVNVN